MESQNTDNVEAFLFELNELLRRHRAVIDGLEGGNLFVTVNGQDAEVGYNRDYLEIILS